MGMGVFPQSLPGPIPQRTWETWDRVWRKEEEAWLGPTLSWTTWFQAAASVTEENHHPTSYQCFKSGLTVLTSWFLGGGLKFLPATAREMAWWLKTLAAPSKDTGSVPNGHTMAHNHP